MIINVSNPPFLTFDFQTGTFTEGVELTPEVRARTFRSYDDAAGSGERIPADIPRLTHGRARELRAHEIVLRAPLKNSCVDAWTWVWLPGVGWNRIHLGKTTPLGLSKTYHIALVKDKHPEKPRSDDRPTFFGKNWAIVKIPAAPGFVDLRALSCREIDQRALALAAEMLA